MRPYEDWLMDGVDREPPTYCKILDHEWVSVGENENGDCVCQCQVCGEWEIFEYDSEDDE